MVTLPPIPPPRPSTEPERLLVYNPVAVTRSGAAARSASLDCPNIVRGLAPWMVERGFTFGADGYLAVLVCKVPEHNDRREVLATLTDENLTRAQVAAVENHPFPAPKPDLATRIRAVSTSSITDPATRTALNQLKEALTEND